MWVRNPSSSRYALTYTAQEMEKWTRTYYILTEQKAGGKWEWPACMHACMQRGWVELWRLLSLLRRIEKSSYWLYYLLFSTPKRKLRIFFLEVPFQRRLWAWKRVFFSNYPILIKVFKNRSWMFETELENGYNQIIKLKDAFWWIFSNYFPSASAMSFLSRPTRCGNLISS